MLTEWTGTAQKEGIDDIAGRGEDSIERRDDIIRGEGSTTTVGGGEESGVDIIRREGIDNHEGNGEERGMT
jgi:hypothetical protein